VTGIAAGVRIDYRRTLSRGHPAASVVPAMPEPLSLGVMSRFVTRREAEPPIDSPETLFRALRPSDPGLRHLWAHQADSLRAYQAVPRDAHDIAVELPTGAGKTLIGQLLAEFRRRTIGQRVAYLCPNIQLARQAAEKAKGYGIQAVLLVGRQTEYDRADFTAFNRANAISISTYHGIFNSNPAIEAQTLVLDDAHAGEGAVADLWSVTVERDDRALYQSLLATVLDSLPEPFAERLQDTSLDPHRRGEVDLVPPRAVAARADVLRDALSEHARDHNRFAGEMIADRVGRCLVYVSWESILIRPLIPPTSGHEAFAGADHRIYMSATLGSGGELERSFGVPAIHRLPAPPGWDEHGSGRRFFLFPSATQSPDAVDEFVSSAIERAGKALVLAPSGRELDAFQASAVPASVPLIRSRDAERDIATFAATTKGVVLLANRYDGIDLPDEACRLVVLSGLPAATHLQERFLYETLGAHRVLTERIRTRIVQGAGRCTRNVQDYAAVIVREARLSDFLSRDEFVSALHPELQAEVRFGLDNSEADADPLDLLDSFLTQDEDWIAADADIRSLAGDVARAEPELFAELQQAAESEVDCWRAVWRGDLRGAIERAQDAADHLGNSSELASYRTLWLYLAASWAADMADETSDALDREWARTLQEDVRRISGRLRWMPRVEPRQVIPPADAEYDSRAERAAEKLRRLGIRGRGFEQRIADFEAKLNDDRATQFELGLAELGELLGFESVRPTGSAAPDAAWRDDTRLWVIFEAKSEESSDNAVSVSEARQAGSHHDWVRGNVGWEEPAHSLTALVSYKQQVDPAAATVARDTTIVDPSVIRAIGQRVIAMYRQVRPRARALDDEQLAAALAAEMNENRLTSEALINDLSRRRVADG
jgi:hypothetical protein